MQETPLRKEIDCFLPARGRTPVISASPCRQWNMGYRHHSHANQKGISAQPVLYPI